MRNLWMGILPGVLDTRVLVQDGVEQTLLKARLPHAPSHPRAVEALGEAVALWCGRKVCAALVADGPDAFCATRPWLDTFEEITRSPLCEIRIVSSARPTRARDRLDGLGSYRALRQIILAEVAR